MDYYQLSIDDANIIKSIEEAPLRTAYIDECGSFGFNFDKGASKYYVICATIIDKQRDKEILGKIDAIRSKFFGNGEMKSSNIGNNKGRRAAILSDILLLDINYIILIADKMKFYKDSPLSNYKDAFKKYLNSMLYESMYAVYPKLMIVEDEYGNDEFQEGYKKYIKEHRPAFTLFGEYDFDYINSKDSQVVQVSDVIAGSIAKHLNNPQEPNVLRMFAGRICDIINFPKQFEEYQGNKGGSGYDDMISYIGRKLAQDYIDRNAKTELEDERIRILFLKQLLFRSINYSNPTYIYADKLIDDLESIIGKRIKRDYLYKNVVAYLRDKGVIIASSHKGYKLPTSTNDLSDYVNQVVSLVGPVLNRIEICRKQIRKGTDNGYDILNNKALAQLKRYFGDYN